MSSWAAITCTLRNKLQQRQILNSQKSQGDMRRLGLAVEELEGGVEEQKNAGDVTRTAPNEKAFRGIVSESGPMDKPSRRGF